mgnify:CR=1 FL=1
MPLKQLDELTSIVSTANGHAIKTPTKDDPNGFGLGIGLSYLETDPPELVFNYEGMSLGYRARYVYFPNRDTVIAVTTNSSTDDNNDHLMDFIGEIYSALIHHDPIPNSTGS